MSLEEIFKIMVISLMVCYIAIITKRTFKGLLDILHSFDTKEESFIAWIVMFILILIIIKVLFMVV
ncbi:TPA: hypothetical protein KQG29_001508 [Clostridioides difficile]|uniref:hypothetical protein n=1 Tax=Clostridioides difficile TaxID=1496 RepID=UPI000D1E1CDF|nr:hypothetical protein [Clostridioides difficile]HBE9444497.1 hypothetical protein [Clostridioides difficile]HBG5344144.1 hypothetical protein [Clostridioides difficile]